MLKQRPINVWAIMATLAAVVLATGWLIRERAFAADKARLLESKTVNLAGIKLEDYVFEGKPRGQIGIHFNGETAGTRNFITGVLRLKPGEEPHPAHRHVEEEILIVADGQGEIFCDGKTTQVGPGSVMYTSPNVLHGIKNTGKEPLTFYFVKWVGVSR